MIQVSPFKTQILLYRQLKLGGAVQQFDSYALYTFQLLPGYL
jgi:hypothetical protein